ncbi:hypothetical protein SAMN06309944_1013 [Micrococcales bacterium KH10]|nr:hypothetical protein SAMN06309944_1013 [Micrococcales bacterium KH10]
MAASSTFESSPQPLSSYQRAARYRGVLWRWRHLRVVVPALVFAILAINAVTPEKPAYIDVAVAAAPLVAGTQLGAQMTRTVAVPEEVATELQLLDSTALSTLIDSDQANQLRVTVPEGTALTAALLSEPGVASLLESGRVAATITVQSGELVQSLQPGDRVDVLLADETQSRRIADAATVLPWPMKATAEPADFAAPTSSLLVSVTALEAAQIATVPLTQWLSVVVVPS